MELTEKQLNVIRCATADLIGALQARNQQDIEIHDWDSHLESIEELVDTFELEDFEKHLEKL